MTLVKVRSYVRRRVHLGGPNTGRDRRPNVGRPNIVDTLPKQVWCPRPWRPLWPLDLEAIERPREGFGTGPKPSTSGMMEGHLWTSTWTKNKKYMSAWHKFATETIGERGIRTEDCYVLVPKTGLRVYEIDSLADLDWLEARYYGYGDVWLDWTKISRDFDAVHLTARGELVTRGRGILHDWDMESTVWFRPKDSFEAYVGGA